LKKTKHWLLSKSDHFKKKKIKIQISQNMATLGSWVSPVRPMAFPYLTANFIFSKYQKEKEKKAVSWVLKLQSFEFLYKLFLPDVGT
jgi:hypothetical protein